MKFIRTIGYTLLPLFLATQVVLAQDHEHQGQGADNQFQHMNKLMQQFQQADSNAERRRIMREHMQQMHSHMQGMMSRGGMRQGMDGMGMMGQGREDDARGKKGSMGDGQGSGMMSPERRQQMQAHMQERMAHMQSMHGMMQQMLNQQKMMMEMLESEDMPDDN